MNSTSKIIIGLSTAYIVGYALWRNYGVVPKNGVVLSSYAGDIAKENTNEQKELINSLSTKPSFTEQLNTTFGKYKFVMTKQNPLEGNWVKYAEIWD